MQVERLSAQVEDLKRQVRRDSSTSSHYIPVYRATVLLCQLAGVAVSAGWVAGIREKAAGLVESSGFMTVRGSACARPRRGTRSHPRPVRRSAPPTAVRAAPRP